MVNLNMYFYKYLLYLKFNFLIITLKVAMIYMFLSNVTITKISVMW